MSSKNPSEEAPDTLEIDEARLLNADGRSWAVTTPLTLRSGKFWISENKDHGKLFITIVAELVKSISDNPRFSYRNSILSDALFDQAFGGGRACWATLQADGAYCVELPARNLTSEKLIAFMDLVEQSAAPEIKIERDDPPEVLEASTWLQVGLRYLCKRLLG